jgi:hypothetical protein
MLWVRRGKWFCDQELYLAALPIAVSNNFGVVTKYNQMACWVIIGTGEEGAVAGRSTSRERL